MSKAAISIIREFSSSSDARLRGNASVGLAALGGPEALRMLLDLSTRDEDPAVRQRAAAEIEALAPDQVSLIKEEILQDLRESGDCTRTYSIAASLVASKRATFVELSPWKSLVCTWKASRFDGKGERLKRFWYTLLSITAGFGAGWLLLGLLVAILKVHLFLDPGYSAINAAFAFQILITIAIGALFGIWNIHWQVQARVGWAALVELCYTAAVVLVVSSAALTFLFIYDSDDWNPSLRTFMVFAAMTLIFVRLTCLCLLIGSRHVTFLRQIPIIAVAFCSGFGFLVVFAKALSLGFEDKYYASIFVLTIPIMTGLLMVFAYRDRRYRVPSYPFGPWARWFCFAIPAIFLVSAVFGLLNTALQIQKQSKQPSQNLAVGTDTYDSYFEIDSDAPIRTTVTAESNLAFSDGGPLAMAVQYNNAPPRTVRSGANVSPCVAKKGDHLLIRRKRTFGEISLLTEIGDWLGLAQPEASSVEIFSSPYHRDTQGFSEVIEKCG